MTDYTWINGKPLCLFGGLLLASYEVGQGALSFDRIDSPAGSGFVVSGRTIGLRTIKLPVHILGDTPEDTQERASFFLREFSAGQVELGLPDGYLYFAVLTKQDGPTFVTEEQISLTLMLQGIRCRPMETIAGGSFEALGTLPEMDCIIETTVGADAQTYTVAGITFDGGDRVSGVRKGEQIVIDGIHKTVMIDGQPAVDRCDLIDFPRLRPGPNTFEGPDPITVKYYPTYL